MKSIGKSFLKYVLTFVIVILLFIATLIISSLFPRDWIEENTLESATTLLQEGNPNYVLDMKLDNYTDALMINTAYSINPNKPFESAMLARKNYLPEKEQTVYPDSNGGLISSADGDYDILGELYKTVRHDISESYEYARYWHGYLIILRPLLIFFNISQIKVIIGILLALLAFYLFMVLSKKILIKFCYIIILALAFSDFFLMGITLQGVLTFVISMVASIIIYERYDKIKNISMYFMVIGMVTCFFDLLTHPIITLGIPITVYLLLKQEKEHTGLKENIKLIIVNSIMWGIGYLLTNLTKWILVDVFYRRNLINIAFEQFLFRSQAASVSDPKFLGEAVIYNFEQAGIRVYLFLAVIFIYVIAYLIRNYKVMKFNVKAGVPYLIISLMPIAWYLLMNNHDVDHSYFTYRGLVVFYIGVGLFLLKLLDNNPASEDGEKTRLEK